MKSPALPSAPASISSRHSASLLPMHIVFKPCTLVQIQDWPEGSTATLYYSDFHCCLNSAVTQRHKDVCYYHYLTYLLSLVEVLLVVFLWHQSRREDVCEGNVFSLELQLEPLTATSPSCHLTCYHDPYCGPPESVTALGIEKTPLCFPGCSPMFLTHVLLVTFNSYHSLSPKTLGFMPNLFLIFTLDLEFRKPVAWGDPNCCSVGCVLGSSDSQFVVSAAISIYFFALLCGPDWPHPSLLSDWPTGLCPFTPVSYSPQSQHSFWFFLLFILCGHVHRHCLCLWQ